MNFVVCIKQTPATTGIMIDPSTGQIRSEGLAYAISPFDEYALEEGVRLKERLGGGWTAALTMGPDRAVEALREAIARGADAGYHLTDPAFDGSDSVATAYILAQGIRKIQEEKGGRIDLVICAKQTNDSDCGQVGPALAAWLDWPATAYVKKIEEINDSSIIVQRLMEDGTDTVAMKLPALVTVVKEINEPRLPSLKGKMASKKAPIPRWGKNDIKTEPAMIGRDGSPTAILNQMPPPSRSAGMKIEGGTAKEKAEKLVAKIKELKLL